MADQIGSNSPTPSGVETPRPDFHDKRLPGIMHSYFGQVGSPTSQNSPLRNTHAATTPEVDLNIQIHPMKHGRENSQSRRSSASSGSMVMVEREQGCGPTPPPDEPDHGQVPKSSDTYQLPPTPISSSASVIQRDGESAENGAPLADGGIASITQALRNFMLPKSSFGTKARRHQSLPVSSVTKNSVPAAHISNPASSSHSPRPQSPSGPSSPAQAQDSRVLEDSNRLTSAATSESRDKSTPPQTPRALSQEDRRNGARSPLSTKVVNTVTSSPSIEHHAKDEVLPTNSPRGKLAVKIAEGRNLKPSYDPYVVCVFEWNEYISKGAKHDKMDIDSDDKKGQVAALQSIPIRRTDSDMGRPMAIPMRSRQSSTNGMNDEGRTMSKVTDPQWDHDATL